VLIIRHIDRTVTAIALIEKPQFTSLYLFLIRTLKIIYSSNILDINYSMSRKAHVIEENIYIIIR